MTFELSGHPPVDILTIIYFAFIILILLNSIILI